MDITINKSFLEPKAFRFLSNNLLKPKSLPHAVIVDVSKARLITGNGFRLIFGLNLTRNSADRCCASAAEPPLPHKKTLPPFFKVE